MLALTTLSLANLLYVNLFFLLYHSSRFADDPGQYDYVEITRDIVTGFKADCSERQSADSESRSEEKTANVTDAAATV